MPNRIRSQMVGTAHMCPASIELSLAGNGLFFINVLIEIKRKGGKMNGKNRNILQPSAHGTPVGRPGLTSLVMLLFFVFSVSELLGHTQDPESGTYKVTVNQTFKIKVFENPGFTCLARVNVASSDETLAAVVPPSSYDVPYDEPHTFEILANPEKTGEVEIITTFSGIDRVNDNPAGPCRGSGEFRIKLIITEDVCSGSPRSRSITSPRSGTRPTRDDTGNLWELSLAAGQINGYVSSYYSANCIYEVSGTYSGNEFTMTAQYIGGETNRDLCCYNATPAVITGDLSHGNLLLVGDGAKIGYNNGDCGTWHYTLFACNESPEDNIITLCDNRANEWKLNAADGIISGYNRSFHEANCVYGVSGTYDADSFAMTSTYVGGSRNRELCCASSVNPAVVTGNPSSNPLSAAGSAIGYNNGDCGAWDYLFPPCGDDSEAYAIILNDDTGNEWKLNAGAGSISGYVHSYHSANCIYDVTGTVDGTLFTMTATYVGSDEGRDFCCVNSVNPGVVSGDAAGNPLRASGHKIGYNNGQCGNWDYTFTLSQ